MGDMICVVNRQQVDRVIQQTAASPIGDKCTRRPRALDRRTKRAAAPAAGERKQSLSDRAVSTDWLQPRRTGPLHSALT